MTSQGVIDLAILADEIAKRFNSPKARVFLGLGRIKNIYSNLFLDLEISDSLGRGFGAEKQYSLKITLDRGVIPASWVSSVSIVRIITKGEAARELCNAINPHLRRVQADLGLLNRTSLLDSLRQDPLLMAGLLGVPDNLKLVTIPLTLTVNSLNINTTVPDVELGHLFTPNELSDISKTASKGTKVIKFREFT